MIKLNFTKEMIAEAGREAEAMGKINNSITNGLGSRAGFLGEIALAKYLSGVRTNSKNHDIRVNGHTIEVKSKRRLVSPRPFYEGSVALTSSHQKPDYYVFLSLTFEKKKVIKNQEYYCGLLDIWYCGAISYSDFITKAVLYKKGQKDPSNGFIVLTDMYNIKYSELKYDFD